VKKSDFDNLAVSIKRAGRIRRGEEKPARVTEVAFVDVKAVRLQLGRSQSEMGAGPTPARGARSCPAQGRCAEP